MSRIRRRYRVGLLAVIVAALVVPVGFALSLTSGPKRPGLTILEQAPVESVRSAAPVLATSNAGKRPFFEDIPDSAMLFLLGTMLVGAATALRKAA